MAAEIKKEIALEIAHVLFIDIVGYSKLSINEQHAAVEELSQIVRAAEQLQRAEAADRLLKIATGDGIALVFYTTPEAPAQCAVQISRALKEHPHLKLRMVIHHELINGVVDENNHPNLAEARLNLAQQLMDCGDAGHILLSKHVADDLEEYEQWRPLLHDLGTCEVKHGARVGVVNLYADQVGNPKLPKKFEVLQKRRTRLRWATTGAAVLMLAALIAGSMILSRSHRPVLTSQPEKSTAALPFENLSKEKANAYFAEGVQDEILPRLSKVADLKVISRTSVMQYRNAATRNLREIAGALGVAHVLEGSVQRATNRVRVNAQLIDARSDAHLWAETYDRDLADVFVLESELAEKIVAQLKTKLSPEEKAAIAERPTKDLAAYDLYARAKTLIETSLFSTPQNESLFEAVRLLNQALQLDPAFALAHYQLAYAHDLLYFLGADHTPARLAMADAAIQSVVWLRPNSGEAHLAVAKHLYWGYLDYDRAREKLNLAQKSLPNDPLPFLLAAYIDRRQSRWDESTKNFERAIELDPQNSVILQQISRSYQCLRRYADAETALDRAVALVPKDTALQASRAEMELLWHADPRPLASTIRAIIGEDSREAGTIAEFWLEVSLCLGHKEDAIREGRRAV